MSSAKASFPLSIALILGVELITTTPSLSLLYRFGHPRTFTLFNPFARHFLCSPNSSLRWGFFVYRWVSHVATRFNGLQQFRLHVTNIRTNSLPLSSNPPLFILRAGRNRSINSIIKNIINLAGKTNTNSCGQGQSTSKQFDWLYSTEFS